MLAPPERPWWKGNFPLWLAIMFLGGLGYFYKKEESYNEEFHRQAAAQLTAAIAKDAEISARIAVLELSIQTTGERLRRIEDKLDAVISSKTH